MASRFDPSAFIEAERRELSQTLAAVASVSDACAIAPEPAENREFSDPLTETLATFATLAAPADQNVIWEVAGQLMEQLPKPAGVKGCDWNALVRLTKWIADDWGQAARESGWHPLEFFGCNPDPYVGRGDRDGVVMNIFRLATPVEIRAVHADHVALVDRGGSVMRYRPFGPRGQAYLWEAYAPKGGP